MTTGVITFVSRSSLPPGITENTSKVPWIGLRGFLNLIVAENVPFFGAVAETLVTPSARVKPASSLRRM